MPNCNNIFYTKAYLKFKQESDKIKVNYFNFNKNNTFAFFPYYIIKRNILNSLKYAGICTNSDSECFNRRIRKYFLTYCKEKNIKRFEIRINPFIKTIKIGKIIKKEPFVCIDLKTGGSELKKKISKKHTKCILKAYNEGLVFNETNDLRFLEIFYKFYSKTLERKGAFPHSLYYFRRMFFYLNKNLSFVYIKYKTEIIAVSILLKANGNIFMMYGGMDELGYKKHAKHFMIYNLIFEFKNKGYHRLILGAGAEGEDSIYKFKRGFTDKDSYIYTYGANI